MFDAKIFRLASSVGLAALLGGPPFAMAQVVDPLKPEGVTGGMSVSDVDSALAAAGYGPPAREPANANPASWGSGPSFHGVRTGMPRAEVREALQRAGYKELSSSAAAAFNKHVPGHIHHDSVRIRYDSDWRVSLVHAFVNTSVGVEQRRQELVDRWGAPDSCTSSEVPEDSLAAKWSELMVKHGARQSGGGVTTSCTWTREVPGEEQSILVRFYHAKTHYLLTGAR